MIAVGITGGIASGKTTVARMFADAGVPVFDADAAVHALYADPPAEIIAAFPAAVVDGKIDRRRLAALIGADPARLDELEALDASDRPPAYRGFPVRRRGGRSVARCP